MNYAALKDEIESDPLTRGYSAMTDQELADDLNTIYRTRNRESMTGKEVKSEIDSAEFNALSSADKTLILTLCNRDDLDPFGIDADVVQGVFGAGTTLSALQAARVENISRAEEIFGAAVTVAAIESARLIQ